MDWMDSLGTVLIIVLALVATMVIRLGGGTTSCCFRVDPLSMRDMRKNDTEGTKKDNESKGSGQKR